MENQSDSDYLEQSSVSNSTISDESITATNLLEDLSEEDILEITQNIYDKMVEYMEENIITISSPNFYNNMTQTISESVFNEWISLDICAEDDEYYEEIHDFVAQILDSYLDSFTIPRREKSFSIDVQNTVDIDSITKQIDILRNVPQPAQKTKEWYEFRNGLISASNLWKVFGTESQRNSLIFEKCQPVNTAQTDSFRCNVDSPMHWGNKYEPVTVMVYEHMFGTKIGEFGCIQHPKYPFIGASPDGINIDPFNSRYGRMLEIKNIVNREITGIPKEEYWIQTQIQMETCNLEECDFMETQFLEYPSETAFYEDTGREYRGVMLHFIERDMKYGSMPLYKYMPIDVSLDKDTIETWITNTREQSKEEGYVLFNRIYWYLHEYSCVLIQRNHSWFKSAVTKIEDLWKIVVKERVEGYEHRAAKKKINVLMNSDLSNSYIIHNMPSQNSICLVKLE
jgi:putative phage-type endonuclease